MMLAHRMVWGIVACLVWAGTQLHAQPFFTPDIKDSNIQSRYRLKFLENQQWKCDEGIQRTIFELVLDTRDTGPADVHVLMCFSAAELLIRMNRLDDAGTALRVATGRLALEEMAKGQRADYHMLLGDIALERSMEKSGELQVELRSQALLDYGLAEGLLPVDGIEAGILARKQGVVKRLLGEHEQALKCFEKAHALTAAGPPREYVKTLQERGIFHWGQAKLTGLKPEKAMADFEEARRIMNRHISKMRREDKILQYFYEGQFALQTDPDRAMSIFEQASAEAPEAMWDCYSGILPYVYNKLGKLHFDQGNYDLSRECYEKQLAFFDRYPPDQQKLVNVYGLLGNTFHQTNDPIQAESYFKKAEYVAASSKNAKLDPAYLVNYGLVLMQLDRWDSCKQYLQEALTSMLQMPVEPSRNIGVCYLNIGYAAINQRHWQEVIPNARLAYKYFKKEPPLIKSDFASIYAVLFTAYSKTDSSLAEKYLDSTLMYIGPVSERNPDYSEAAILVAEYLNSTGRPTQALEIMHNELRRLVGGFDSNAFDAIPDYNNARSPWHTLRVTLIKARALYLKHFANDDTRMLRMSLELYMAAIRLISKDRVETHLFESRLRMAGLNRSVFEEAIAVSAHLYLQKRAAWAKDSALTICEQGKGMILTEALLASEAAATSGIPASELAKISDLEENLARLKVMSNTGNPKTQVSSRNNMFRVEQELRRNRERLKQTYPYYYGQLYNAGKVEVSDLQLRLHRDTATVLEYFMTDTVLYTFVFTADTFELQSTPLNAKFFATLKEYCAMVRRAPKERDTPQFLCHLGHELYEILIGDIDIPITERLIIIPDGYLNYLPFDALVRTPCIGDAKFETLDYLVKTKVISYNYSASFVQREDLAPLTKPARILGVAPSFGGASNLPKLKFASEGIQNLKRLFAHTDILIDDEATVRQFKAIAADYDIIDLATHAIVDTANPMQSSLFFTADSSGGKLTQQEVFSMKLKARLAVLGACGTGSGTYSKGEGVMSLARGFSYAECRSVMMGLWVLPDEGTKRVMDIFYGNMANGMALDHALTRAKRHYLEQVLEDKETNGLPAKPFNWASMVLIGDYSSIEVEKNNHGIYLPYYAALLVLIMGIAAYWYFLRRPKPGK